MKLFSVLTVLFFIASANALPSKSYKICKGKSTGMCLNVDDIEVYEELGRWVDYWPARPHGKCSVSSPSIDIVNMGRGYKCTNAALKKCRKKGGSSIGTDGRCYGIGG